MAELFQDGSFITCGAAGEPRVQGLAEEYRKAVPVPYEILRYRCPACSGHLKASFQIRDGHVRAYCHKCDGELTAGEDVERLYADFVGFFPSKVRPERSFLTASTTARTLSFYL